MTGEKEIVICSPIAGAGHNPETQLLVKGNHSFAGLNEENSESKVCTTKSNLRSCSALSTLINNF